MKYIKYLLLYLFTFIFGVLFFAYQNEWLIIATRFPVTKNNKQEEYKELLQKKIIKLFCWQNNKYKSEDTEIMISENIAENIKKIITCWLNLLEEEKILDKVTLQSTLMTKSTQEVYLSFDGPILNPENSTYEKLMLIESLLKTLKENDIINLKIYFLIHHQEMVDNHLDFLNPWPINGFLQVL